MIRALALPPDAVVVDIGSGTGYGGHDAREVHFGLGSAIMMVNVALLSFYTLGCHSLRHLVGGKLDCFSCSPVARFQYGLWSRVTMLNSRHMLWAWLSLVWVAFTDWYIRYLATTGLDRVLGVPA